MPAYTKADEIQGVHAWAWGRHVVAGHKVQKVTDGSGTTATTTVIVLLGQGVWESIEAAYFGGTLIDPSQYHFHRGYLSDNMNVSDDPDTQGIDSRNVGGQTYSGTAYVVIKLPAGVTSDDDLSKLKFICKTRRVPDFNADGTRKLEGQLDSEGQVLGKGGLSYSANPARVMADLLITARGLNPNRINWTAWVAWRDFCNFQIAWVGGESVGRPDYSTHIGNIIVGSDASANKAYGIPATGWNAGARTVASIPNNTIGGFYEWDAGVGTHIGGLMFAVGTPNGNPESNTHFKYGLQCQADGSLRLVNDGFDVGIIGSWAMGDRFRVGWRNNGGVWQPYFQKNGVDIDVSAKNVTGWNGAAPLYGGVAFYTFHSEILRASFSPINSGARTRKRFECSLAFSSSTDVANAIEAILFVSCSHFQQADGKFIFLAPPMVGAPRPAPLADDGTPLTFSMDNISTSSFKTYRLSPDQRPTRFKGVYRDADNPYLEEASVEVLREQLADSLGRHKDAPEVYMGTINRAQALCVLNFHARMNSDLDLFAKFDASGETWSALPSDIIPVSHDVPGWDAAKMMVIDAEDYSGMETADRRGFVVQVMPQDDGLYSDDDQRPLVVTLPVTTPSILSTPPAASWVSLVQDSAHGVNNTFVTKIRGRVLFGNFGNKIQRARVYVTRPGDVERISNIILTPDPTGYDEFEFTPTTGGTYTFRVETMNEIALSDKLITHPSMGVTVGNISLSLPVPVTPTARYMAGSVVYSWFRPLTNPERVKRAELRRDNGTGTAPDLTDAGLVYEGDATSAVENFTPPMPATVTRWLRFKDDMGNASAWVKVGGAAIPVVSIPAVTGFDFSYRGNGFVGFAWTPLSIDLSIAEYQISTQTGVNFESNIVVRDMGNTTVYQLPAGASRTQGYYIRAVDTYGNKGTVSALVSKTFAAPAAPTVSVDATASYQQSFKLRINPGTVDPATVKRTVVHVRNNIAGTPLLYDLEYDGLAESAVILGRSTTPNVVVTAEYQDFFAAPYNVSGSVTYTFTQFLGTDIANNAIGVNHIQDGILTTAKFASTIKPVQLYSASTTVLPTLPNASYPVDTLLMWTNAADPTNRTLWRNDNNVWSKDTVAGSSISGTIPAAAIPNGAIDDAKLDTASSFYKITQSKINAPFTASGDVSWTGTALTWTARFLSLPNALSSDGYIEVLPLSNVTIGSTWGALVYRFRIGANHTNDNKSGVLQTSPQQGLFVADYLTYGASQPPAGYTDFLLGYRSADTGNFHLWDGRFMRTGDTLRYNSGVPDASILAAQIATQAIDFTKFASGIAPVYLYSASATVLPTLPSTSYPIGTTLVWTNATDLTMRGKLFRNDNNVWTKAVTAGDLSADSVTAGTVAAGAINTRELAAQAITGEKLAIGVQTEQLVPNPGFELAATDVTTRPESWVVTETANTSAQANPTWGYDASQYSEGRRSLVISTPLVAAGCRAFPVTPGEKYSLRCKVKSTGTAGSLFVQFNELTSLPAGGYIGLAAGYIGIDSRITTRTGVKRLLNGGDAFVPSTEAGAIALNTLGAWTEVSGTYTPAAGVQFVTVAFYFWNTTVHGNANGSLWVDDVSMNRQVGTTVIADGAISTAKVQANAIQAGNIAAGQIQATHIASAQITAAHLQAGIITADKLAVGIQPGNLIANGSFESDLAGWAAIYDPYPGVATRATGVAAPEGDYVMAFPSGVNTASGYRAVPVDAGATYAVRFKFKPTTASGQLILQMYERTSAPPNGSIDARAGVNSLHTVTTLINSVNISTYSINAWNDIMFAYTPTAGSRWVSLVLQTIGTPSGVNYFDRVEMVRQTGNTYIEGGSITTDKIVASGISGTVITAGTMSADRIIANKGIVASQIAAGAISATEIAAKAIRVEQLAVGLGDNLIENGTFNMPLNARGYPTGWDIVWATSANGSQALVQDATAPGGQRFDVTALVGGIHHIGCRAIPIDDTKKYALRIRFKISGGGVAYAGVYESSALTLVGGTINTIALQPDFVTEANRTSGIDFINAATAAQYGAWTTLDFVYTPTAGAKWATIKFGTSYAGSNTTISVGEIEFRAQVGTAFIQDLAVDTGKIKDLAVTSAKILSLDAEKLTAAVGRIGLLLPTQVISSDYVRHQPSTYHSEAIRWRGLGANWQENADYTITRTSTVVSPTIAYGHRAIFNGDATLTWVHNGISHYTLGLADARNGLLAADHIAGWHFSTTAGSGNGNMYTRYGGLFTDMGFQPVVGDDFRIDFASTTGTITWYRNGIQMRQVTGVSMANPTYPVAHQYVNGHVVPTVTLTGYLTDTVAPPVVWENFLNTSVDSANVVSKTTLTDGYDNYATGVELMPANAGGYCQWNSYTGDGRSIIGFLYASDTISAASQYTNIRYGLFHFTTSAGVTGDNSISAMESGSGLSTGTSGYDGVQLEIDRVYVSGSWYIIYRRDGVAIRQVNLGATVPPAMRLKYAGGGIGAKGRNVKYVSWGVEGKGWKLHPRQGSDQIGIIESNDGFMVKNSPLNEIGIRALGAIAPDLQVRGSDTGKVNVTKPLSLDVQQYDATWESNFCHVHIRFSMTNALTDSTCNCISADLMRVRVYNMFGDVIREVELPCPKGTGGGLIMHAREYADPREQAVYSVEIRNYYGWSTPMYYSLATDRWLSGVFTNRGTNPPTWYNRNLFARNVNAEAIDATSVKLTWTPAPNGGTQSMQYRVFSVDGRNAWLNSVEGWYGIAAGVTTGIVTGLSANTRYEFMIHAVTGWCWSSIAYARTYPTPLAAPTRSAPAGLSLQSNDAGTLVTATWTRMATDNTGVTFEYRDVTGGGSWVTTTPGQVVTANFATTAGRVYEARVKNTWGSAPTESAYSNTQQITTNTPAPVGATPVGLSVTGNGYFNITLAWQANGGSSPYIEYYRDGATAWGQNNTPASGATTANITGLLDGYTYYFRVRNNSPATSGWSNTAIGSTDQWTPPDTGGGDGCVVYDTPITIVGVGGMEGTVRAADVEPGMKAVSVDQNGLKVIGTVKNVFKAMTSRIFTFVTDDGAMLTCSPSHPIIAATGEVRYAHSILNGDAVMVYNLNTDRAHASKIVSVEYIDIPVPVLIFEMENAEHTFVSGGIVSHNISKKTL